MHGASSLIPRCHPCPWCVCCYASSVYLSSSSSTSSFSLRFTFRLLSPAVVPSQPFARKEEEGGEAGEKGIFHHVLMYERGKKERKERRRVEVMHEKRTPSLSSHTHTHTQYLSVALYSRSLILPFHSHLLLAPAAGYRRLHATTTTTTCTSATVGLPFFLEGISCSTHDLAYIFMFAHVLSQTLKFSFFKTFFSSFHSPDSERKFFSLLHSSLSSSSTLLMLFFPSREEGSR